MMDLHTTLLPYVPSSLLRQIHANPILPEEPRAYRFPAALLFADVSGFTPLTERLARFGPRGAEELTRLINTYFDQMIALLDAEGGEVVKFGGDSLVALFPAHANLLVHAVLQAQRAGIAMQEAMTQFHQSETSAGPVELRMKISIGAGEVITLHVGGVADSWEYVVAGDPMRQVAEAEKTAAHSTVVLSPEAQAVLDTNVAPVPVLAHDNQHDPQPSNLQTVAPILNSYLPLAVQTALQGGRPHWLGMLRLITVMFLKVDGLDYTDPNVVRHLHTVITTIQTTVNRYQGSIARVSVDDKGTVLLILFGAPPLTHEDDTLRAMHCALQLQQQTKTDPLRAANIQFALGLTTGRVFAGPVGSAARREYTVMGDTVNLAARLMTKAGPGGILCDVTTHQHIHNHIAFTNPAYVELKGKAGLVPIYTPIHIQGFNGKADSTATDTTQCARSPLVGRQPESAQIRTAFDALQDGVGQALIIEGAAGIGKSRLVTEMIAMAEARTITVLTGRGDVIEQQSPYSVWRDVFTHYFGLASIPDPATRQEQVHRIVHETVPDQAERLPLLNDILELHFPDTPFTTTLDPLLRQQGLALFLVSLLRVRATQQPLMIVLEDTHWLDSLSWGVAAHIAQSLLSADVPLLLVLAARPLDNAGPSQTQIELLRTCPKTTTLHLDALQPEETAQLVTLRLGLNKATLPATLPDLIHQHAGGNPLFVEELVTALYNQGYISIQPDATPAGGMRCTFHGDVGHAMRKLPTRVESLILARIDRLPSDAQITLKVAAVIGHVFAYDLLRDILHIQQLIDDPTLRHHLKAFITHDITQPRTQTPHLDYIFKQIIAQEAIYQSLLFEQRRAIHRAVAQWYERQYGGQERALGEPADTSAEPHATLAESLLARYYARLVYHYRLAQDLAKERYYARLAGEHAADRYANAEAVTHLTRALELTPTNDIAEHYNLLRTRERVLDILGDRDAQARDLTTLAALARYLNNTAFQAEIALRQAHYHNIVGNYPAAIIAARRVITFSRHHSDGEDIATAYLQLAEALCAQGNYTEASQHLDRALRLIREARLSSNERIDG